MAAARTRLWKSLWTASLLSFAAGVSAAGNSVEEKEWLGWMLGSLPPNPPWAEWQARTGAMPPDFASLARSNRLPDPMRFLDGRKVETDADWQSRRAEIRGLFEKYVLGSFPPKPQIGNVVVLEEVRSEGFVTRNLRIEFGPEGKGSVRVQLTIPDGAKPRPVLMSPGLTDSWAAMTLRRGYASVVYAGNDAADDGANLGELYPDHDFAALPRRAWLASIVLDYLETLPELDASRVALFGYSRDGKMATIAAAFDERFAALIAGSTGVGGLLPWRFSGERGNGEGIETTTRMFPTWFAPQLRFFSGREDRLPVDANLLLALIAPRPVLMEYGTNDEVSNVWGMEQVYHAVLPLYEKAGAGARLGLLRAPGFHDGIIRGQPGVIQESCLDWLDIQFGRSVRLWVNDFVFPWDFESWRKLEGNDVAATPSRPTGGSFEKRAGETRRAVEWMLGERPPVIPGDGPVAAKYRGFRFPPPPGPVEVTAKGGGSPGQFSPDVAAWVIGRGGQEFGWLEPEKNQVESRRVRFGLNVVGDLYLPAGTPADKKLPAVIWLHGFSHPLGYMWVYRRDLHPILALTRAGFAVLAFDQTGFGTRWQEAGSFYDRFPRWSRMGRMVEDVQRAIDGLGGEANVDPSRIGLLGYTMGGAVALHASALDPRVKCVASVAGFTPMRTDTTERGLTGALRYSHDHGLLPRVGLFAHDPASLPYDFDDLIALAAPRPVLIVQPRMDRDADPAAVRAAVAKSREAYEALEAGDRLELMEPDDYARLSTATQDRVVVWLRENL